MKKVDFPQYRDRRKKTALNAIETRLEKVEKNAEKRHPLINLGKLRTIDKPASRPLQTKISSSKPQRRDNTIFSINAAAFQVNYL